MPPLRHASFGMLLLALTGLLVAGAPAPATAAPTTVSGIRLNSHEARVLSLINQHRTSRGLPALSLQRGPTWVARYWAGVMAGQGRVTHNPHWGPSTTIHANAACPAWNRIAENVAHDTRGADAIVGQWMASSVHRNNILHAGLRHVGVGSIERRFSDGSVRAFTVTDFCTFDTRRGPTFGAQMATGIRPDRVAVTSTRAAATWESPSETQRTQLARVASNMNSAGPTYSSGLANDYARFVAANLNSSASGRVELQVRDALDLTRVREVSITLSQTNPTGKTLLVQVFATEPWVSSAGATLSVPSGTTPRTLRFALPAAARTYRSQLRVAITSGALARLGTGSAAQATIRVYGISLTV